MKIKKENNNCTRKKGRGSMQEINLSTQRLPLINPYPPKKKPWKKGRKWEKEKLTALDTLIDANSINNKKLVNQIDQVYVQ